MNDQLTGAGLTFSAGHKMSGSVYVVTLSLPLLDSILQVCCVHQSVSSRVLQLTVTNMHSYIHKYTVISFI